MPRIALGTFAVLLGLTAIIGLGQMVYAWTAVRRPPQLPRLMCGSWVW